jgi:hypothetical protein
MKIPRLVSIAAASGEGDEYPWVFAIDINGKPWKYYWGHAESAWKPMSEEVQK